MTLKQTKINASNINKNEIATKEPIEVHAFNFLFSIEYAPDSSKTVSIQVPIPINSHTGKIGEYMYTAKLETSPIRPKMSNLIIIQLFFQIFQLFE